MKEQNVRRIPVTENGRLAGLITFDDLVVDGSVGLDALLSIVTSQLEVEAPPKPAGLLHPQGPGQAEQRPVFGGAGPRGKAARRRTRSRPPSPGAARKRKCGGRHPHGVHRVGGHSPDVGERKFVMLYLLFFLLRDEDALSKRIRDAIPLQARDKVERALANTEGQIQHTEQQRAFLLKFTTVIRATVKGDMLVSPPARNTWWLDILVVWDSRPAVMGGCDGLLFVATGDWRRPDLDPRCRLSLASGAICRACFDSIRHAHHRPRG